MKGIVKMDILLTKIAIYVIFFTKKSFITHIDYMNGKWPPYEAITYDIHRNNRNDPPQC